MTPFELAEPTSLKEAVALLDADDPAVRPIAGGTALMLMMKAGMFRPSRLVSLRRIGAEHSGITATGGALHIGAMASLRSLERSDVVRANAPVIVDTLRALSNVRVRNVATVGGHLAHGDPHQDLPPVLIALGATVTTVGPKGERTIPLDALYGGYFTTTLARDELIGVLTVPTQTGRRAAYLKCTTRAAHDWPALGIAVSLGETDARIVIGAATETPTRLKAAEQALGTGRDEAAIARAADAAADEVTLDDDTRGSAAYKRELVRVYVGRALRRARGNQGAG